MSHPLDDWVAGLRPLRHGSLRAYVAESWFEEPAELGSWSPEQVRLARMVFRPSPADTREVLDAWMMFDEDEEPDETKELRNAWLCPAGPLWEEIAPRGIALPELYSVLLASAGRGGDAVLECDAQALVKMRELSAAHGYRDMVRAVKHARRVQQIFRSGRSWR